MDSVTCDLRFILSQFVVSLLKSHFVRPGVSPLSLVPDLRNPVLFRELGRYLESIRRADGTIAVNVDGADRTIRVDIVRDEIKFTDKTLVRTSDLAS